MKLMFLLALFIPSTLQCMELAISSQILLPPDIIKLIAYALVDTTPQGILVDDPSRSHKANKQLLIALQNFAATNKIIHTTIYNLRYGIDKEAIHFNCHFYTQMGSHITTAAFMGTPWALNIILDKRFKELDAKYGKKIAIKEFNKLLGAREKRIPQYAPVDFTEMPPGYRGTPPSIMTGYDYKDESITKTMVKFPPSTRQFILELMSE